MKRRHFLCSGSAALAGTALVAKTDPQEFALDRTRLILWREENRFFAPSRRRHKVGWPSASTTKNVCATRAS